MDALREVCRGGSPMTTHIARKVVQSFQKAGVSAQPTENLSAREQEVLDCLSQGFLYKEIAEKLGISYETVHTLHPGASTKKLQVRTPHRSRRQIPAPLKKPGPDVSFFAFTRFCADLKNRMQVINHKLLAN